MFTKHPFSYGGLLARLHSASKNHKHIKIEYEVKVCITITVATSSLIAMFFQKKDSSLFECENLNIFRFTNHRFHLARGVRIARKSA
jgi:hypothetical protein